MGYAAAAGLLMSAGGAFLGGKAGDIARERLKGAANLPGVDTRALTEQALADQLATLPQASKLAGQVGTANQAQLLAQEEQALPGVGAARQQALGSISGLFSDDAAWLKGVQQRGAALGLSSGLRGSGAGQLATLKLSDQEKMQRTQLGTGLLGSLIGSMRLANTPGVQSFLGPTANQLIDIRSQERSQRQALLAQASQIPGQTAAWGNWLTQTGGALMGAGTMGMMGGAGGGGGAGMGGGGAVNSFGGSWNTPYYNFEDAATARQYGLTR